MIRLEIEMCEFLTLTKWLGAIPGEDSPPGAEKPRGFFSVYGAPHPRARC